MIFRSIIDAHSWTIEQIANMTLRQLRIVVCDKTHLDWIGREFNTKEGRKREAAKVDKAVENLIAGKRWDAK